MNSQSKICILIKFIRKYSVSAKEVKHYKAVVAGGGTGGCSVAARLCRVLGPGNVAVVEPSKYHYYQSLWSLVGAGIKTFEQSARLSSEVLPVYCHHYAERVAAFDPSKNRVTLGNGEQLSYDYLVIALGIEPNYQKAAGLLEALKADPSVVTVYDKDYVVKNFNALQNFKGGKAVFTFPSTPIKCAGVAQLVMYMAEEYWRKTGVRDKTDIMYHTSLNAIFVVKKYSDELVKVANKKNIKVNLRHNLVAVDHNKKEATFQNLDSEKGETMTCHYDFMHVAPPMSAPTCLQNSTFPIVDAAGFLDINKYTMQHNKFPNIFGLGDCTNIPTSRTAAAVAAQNKILLVNMKDVLEGKAPSGKYDGYTACPIITSYHHCILAEFDFDGKPLETFPFNQARERRTIFQLKANIMPAIYWRMMLKGNWAGPRIFRKIMHLGFSR